MICNVTEVGKTTFLIMLSINSSGALLAIISFACVLANTSIDPATRGILLSYSAANLIGSGMLTFESIILICVGKQFLTFAVTITMTLSVSHMMLLILAEYISITTSTQQRAGDHSGLLLVAWIISLTFGGMNVVDIGQNARIAFAVFFLLALFLMMRCYIVVLMKDSRKKSLLEGYKKTFLRITEEPCEKQSLEYSWIHILAVFIFTYVACSIPWVLNEFREGIGSNANRPLLNTIGIIIYSLHFYFPSLVCIYLRYRQHKLAQVEQPSISHRFRENTSELEC